MLVLVLVFLGLLTVALFAQWEGASMIVDKAEITLERRSGGITVGVAGTPWRYYAADVAQEADATRPLCVDAGRGLYLSLDKTRELGRLAKDALAWEVVSDG